MGAVGAVGFCEHIAVAVRGFLGSSGIDCYHLREVISGSVVRIATVSAADTAEGSF